MQLGQESLVVRDHPTPLVVVLCCRPVSGDMAEDDGVWAYVGATSGRVELGIRGSYKWDEEELLVVMMRAFLLFLVLTQSTSTLDRC